jgi:PAS domain S-box-containing protein
MKDHNERPVSRDASLHEALAETELLLSTISAALIGIDTNDRVTRWNTASELLFGIPASVAIGRKLGETGIALEWDEVFIAIGQCLTLGRPINLHDMRYTGADGREGFISLYIASSWSATGDGSENLGVVMLGIDTTEQKLNEAQRGQSLKMESIGQLAAGIAHEINTPIQFIGDNLRFLKDSFGDLQGALQTIQGDPTIPSSTRELLEKLDLPYLLEEIPKALGQSLEGTDRVAQIVRAMKEFSHPDTGEKKRVDLNHALVTSSTVSRNEYKYVADLVTELDPVLPPVMCLAGELNQVFVNLIVNAAHAIADANGEGGRFGRITLATRVDGDHVEIRISDTGTGIPEKVRPRIFDPFFTTKGVGKGTGQGLYLAHTIVTRKHHGSITFETIIGQGTTFIIRLPVDGGEES